MTTRLSALTVPASVGPHSAAAARSPARADDALANQAAALAGKQGARLDACTMRLDGAAGFAVCLPVRDEAALLPDTLAALERAMAAAAQPGLCVFLLNDTNDGSAAIIERWARAGGHAHLLAAVRFDRAAASAPRARRVALDIGLAAAPGAPLLTTDADTRVAPGWIAANLRWLGEGHDLVCGTVDADRAEADALPAPVRRCGAVEAAYSASLARLWRRWAGPGAPDPAMSVMGASLAMRAAALQAVGGLPVVPVAEDRALAQAMLEAGLRVAEAADARVATSLRLHGRAAGGVGDTLRRRTADPDPPCDEKLVPLAVLRQRARLWRTVAGTRDAVARFARATRFVTGGLHPRMSLSQVERELARAERLLRTTKPNTLLAEAAA